MIISRVFFLYIFVVILILFFRWVFFSLIKFEFKIYLFFFYLIKYNIFIWYLVKVFHLEVLILKIVLRLVFFYMSCFLKDNNWIVFWNLIFVYINIFIRIEEQYICIYLAYLIYFLSFNFKLLRVILQLSVHTLIYSNNSLCLSRWWETICGCFYKKRSVSISVCNSKLQADLPTYTGFKYVLPVIGRRETSPEFIVHSKPIQNPVDSWSRMDPSTFTESLATSSNYWLDSSF